MSWLEVDDKELYYKTDVTCWNFIFYIYIYITHKTNIYLFDYHLKPNNNNNNNNNTPENWKTGGLIRKIKNQINSSRFYSSDDSQFTTI